MAHPQDDDLLAQARTRRDANLLSRARTRQGVGQERSQSDDVLLTQARRRGDDALLTQARARQQAQPGTRIQEFFGGMFADTGRSLIEGVRALPGAAIDKAQRERDEASMLRDRFPGGDPRIVGATRQALIRGEVSRPEQPPLTLEAIKAMAGEGTTARKVGRVTGEIGLLAATGPLGRLAQTGTRAAIRGVRGAVRRVTTPRAPRQLSLLDDIPPGRPVAAPVSDAGASVGVTPSQAPRVAPAPSGTAPRGIPAPSAAAEPVQGTLNLTGGPPRGLDGSLITTKQVFAEPTSGRLHTVIDVKADGRILVAETGRELGTRKPSFLITPEESNAINFANPRQGLEQAFAKTGKVSKTIQEIKAGLNSDQLVRGVEGVTPAPAGMTLGGQRLVGGVSPASTLRRDLAVTGAGAGAGAAAGAIFSPDDRFGGALAGGLITAGLSIRGQNRLASLAARGIRGIDVLLLLRREGYLSGLALPKNIITALTAPVNAAIETRSFRPLLEIPRITKDVVKGVINPKGKKFIAIDDFATSQRQAGVVSPRIGVVDAAVDEGLKRGFDRVLQADSARVARRAASGKPPRKMPERGIGTTPAEIQAQVDRLVVKTPLKLTIGGDLFRALRTKKGQAFVPFQKTPGDIAVGGATEAFEMVGGPPTRGALGMAARRRALSAATAGAGLVAGEVLGDEGFPGVLAASLLAASFGRRQMLFAPAAALTGGPDFIRGLTPLPDNTFDLLDQFKPSVAFLNLMDQLTR